MKQLPEDMLRQFWQESKKEAPEGFSNFIMQNLPQQVPLSDNLKKPLLSPRLAILLGAFLAAVALLLSNLKLGNKPNEAWQQFLEQELSGGWALLNTSSSLLTSLAILSAALVLLMGLDRFLQRVLGRSQEQ